MSYHIHDFMYKIKEQIDDIQMVYREFLDINSLILKTPLEDDQVVVPLKNNYTTVFKSYNDALVYIDNMFKASNLYNKDLKLVEFIETNGLIFTAEDFGPVNENYTYDFIKTNICNFSLNWTNGMVEYRQEPYSSKDSLKEVLGVGCSDMVGDVNDRIADIFKLNEILLLYLANKLTAEEKAKVDKILANLDRNNLVVSKKYSDVSCFLDKFVQRQETVRRIMDRKIQQHEEKGNA